MRRAALVFLVLLGCAAPTRIDSRPSGARVLIERQFVGYTPLELTLSARCGTVRIEAPGHEAVEGALASRGDPRAWSALLLPPVLLIPAVPRRPHPAYLIELRPGSGVERWEWIPPAAAAPPSVQNTGPVLQGQNSSSP